MTYTPTDMEQVASLLVRQDMELAREGLRAGYEQIRDYAAMGWAVATAGHLFDQHELWDYDLLSDADHVHRCTDYRHDGPGTRGLFRG